MTITQLEYVLAVAKHRNFTLASEKCFVTQPTLSMQIQKLEDELSVQIFDRSKKPIELTAIGKVIVDQANTVVTESKRISDIVDKEKGRVTGEFKIGIIPTIIPTLLPLFLKTFTKRYTEVNVIVEELQTHEIIKQLKDGVLDIGIVATPLNEQDLIEKPLYYEPFAAYLPQGHSLLKKSKIKPTDLEVKDMLLLEEGHCFRNNVINLCKPDHEIRTSKLRLNTGSFDALMQLTQDGFGYTLLPYLHTKRLSDSDREFIREFENPVPSREVSLLYSKSQLKLQIIKALEKTISSIVRGVILTEDTQIISPL
ncbi:MAG: LysR family transcriptional regulator [Ichthyobacteriaceae bacterium]|nr:LysR family transcriptional regulator [Ichthyobacteriaceae bacterium]